jgi:hypothetical protein
MLNLTGDAVPHGGSMSSNLTGPCELSLIVKRQENSSPDAVARIFERRA